MPDLNSTRWNGDCLCPAMNRLLVALLSLLPLTPALAVDAVQAPDSLRRAAMVAVQAANPQLRVSALPLDERLRLPACGQALQATPEPVRGGQVRVAVACAAPSAWTVYVGVRISDLRPVLTLARSAARGQALEGALLTLQERDVTALPFGYFSSPAELAGMQLRRAATAGAVITPDLVEAPKLVRRGDLVTLVGRSGAIEVRSQGKALKDGGRGERIPVENSSSRRVVEGRISASGEIEVAL